MGYLQIIDAPQRSHGLRYLKVKDCLQVVTKHVLDMDEDMDFVGDDADEVLDDDEDEENGETKTYLPGEPVAEGSELVCDDSAYVLYHQAQTGFTNTSL